MKYFAYGSNMLTERLAARVSAANPIPHALVGYRLRFHKRSVDCSGKCNIEETGCHEDVVHGVIFDVPDAQKERLDDIEGVGRGYYGYRRVQVAPSNGSPDPTVEVYLAEAEAIDEALVPYAWYRDLVMTGAEQHGLPLDYRARISAVPFVEDPEPARQSRRDALDALRKYHEVRGRYP